MIKFYNFVYHIMRCLDKFNCKNCESYKW